MQSHLMRAQKHKKEPWNFGKFKYYYKKMARKVNACSFPSEIPESHLKHHFQKSKAPSIGLFALEWLLFEEEICD